MNKYRLSIVVPVYNAEKTIKKCVESLINQTYKNLEIILVDDGSKDNTLNICNEISKIDNRIKVISQKNGGPSKARNVGIKAAKGDYITFVDSDDYLEIDMYKVMMAAAQKNKCDIVACGIRHVDKNFNKILENKPNNKIMTNNQEIIQSFLTREISPSTCDKIYKRDSIKDVYFNENIKNNEDKLFVFHCILKSQNLQILKYIGYNYVDMEGSNSKKLSLKDYEGMELVAATIKENVKFELQKYTNYFYCMTLLEICRTIVKSNQFNIYKKYYFKIVNQMKKISVDINLIENKNRKLEIYLLKNFPTIYVLFVKIYFKLKK